MRAAPVLVRCRSFPQVASFGPLPPRTPARPDPQVPNDLAAGPSLYAKLPHLYFYDANHPEDPTFGFVDLEISLQRQSGDRVLLDLYCTGDGHQSGAGLPSGQGIRIEILAGQEILDAVNWEFREVGSGRCDPVSFSTWLDLKVDQFDLVDAIRIPPSAAVCRLDG